MIHLAQFSGGKDSTAMLLYLKDQGIDYTAVFCDTGWEHPLTYAYIEEINRTVLGEKLMILKPLHYWGFEDLVEQKQMFPNRFARFCTQELKVLPLHKFIESADDDVTSYIGVRSDESAERRDALEEEWCEDAGGFWIRRPLLRWTAAQCFDLMKRHGIAPNPLYLHGAGRVGCFPCVFVNLRELKAFLTSLPEIRSRLNALEAHINRERHYDDYRTFFRHGFIPDRFCSARSVTAKGRSVVVPTVEDVFRYLESVDENQLPLFEAPKCMSIYNLCE